MYGIVILLVFVLVAFAQGSNSSQFSNWRSSWIMGGKQAAPSEFKHMVSLRNTDNFQHFCGGSLINSRYILTAAHCVYGKSASSIIVVTGRNVVNPQGIHRFGVSQIIPYPIYSPSTYSDDIAVIRVDKPIHFNHVRRSAKLPHGRNIIFPGTICAFAGWGKTSASATSYSNVLWQTQLKVMSDTACLNAYPHLSENYFCADAGPGKGLCMGDGGGSLMCGELLMGVYSGGGQPGTTCSTPYPSVFVNVANYAHWILSVLIGM